MSVIYDYVKKKGRWFFFSCVLLIVIGVAIYISQSQTNKLKFCRAEQGMAQSYTPTTRQALFDLVINDKNYKYLDILGKELDSTLSSMASRLRFRYNDMNDYWGEFFIPHDSDDLVNKTLHEQGLRTYSQYFSYLSQFDTLTQAEIDSMRLIHDVWKKYDNIIIENDLDYVHVILSGASGWKYSGKGSKPLTSIHKIQVINADANDLAKHFYDFTVELYQLPRTVNNFFYDVNAYEQLRIESSKIDKEYIVEPKVIKNTIDILRKYNYYKAEDVKVDSKQEVLRIIFMRNDSYNGSRSIRFYDGYIEVSGIYDDFDSIYDYVQKKYDFIPMVNGLYKVDNAILEDIKAIFE